MLEGQKQTPASAYVPCTDCHGMFLSSSIWQHVKECVAKPREDVPKSLCHKGHVVMASLLPQEEEEDRLISLFAGMKEMKANPGVKTIYKNDKLIREFASLKFARIGQKVDERLKDISCIRSATREIGRLLKLLNAKENRWCSLASVITAPCFNEITNAILTMGQDCANVALSIADHIDDLALIKQCWRLRSDNAEMKKKAEEFMILHNALWKDTVTPVLLKHQRLSKLNKPIILPTTEDLTAFTEFLVCRIKCIVENPSVLDCTDLSNLLIAQIILFNKRRVAEVSEITINDYKEGFQNNASHNTEIITSWTHTEKQLKGVYA